MFYTSAWNIDPSLETSAEKRKGAHEKSKGGEKRTESKNLRRVATLYEYLDAHKKKGKEKEKDSRR